MNDCMKNIFRTKICSASTRSCYICPNGIRSSDIYSNDICSSDICSSDICSSDICFSDICSIDVINQILETKVV
jgi:hypothetical protein